MREVAVLLDGLYFETSCAASRVGWRRGACCCMSASRSSVTQCSSRPLPLPSPPFVPKLRATLLQQHSPDSRPPLPESIDAVAIFIFSTDVPQTSRPHDDASTRGAARLGREGAGCRHPASHRRDAARQAAHGLRHRRSHSPLSPAFDLPESTLQLLVARPSESRSHPARPSEPSCSPPSTLAPDRRAPPPTRWPPSRRPSPTPNAQR